MSPRLARTAGMISVATMLSRVLGLVREQLFAALLGATMFADAFVVAFRIPNLLRDLFAEGALSQAFVPTFKARLKQQGPEAAYALANVVSATLFTVVAAICLVAALVTPSIVTGLAGDFAEVPGKLELTTTLTRVMLPFLPAVSLAAVAMGMLNAQDRYAAPALAPAMFNVLSIATGLSLWMAGAHGRTVAIGWAIGTVLGGVAQLAIQLPPLWRVGFRPRPRLDLAGRDPGLRRVAALMGPAVLGLAAVQVNVFVNTLFASSEPGGVAWLNYAFRFLQLPIGVFGVAIATVSMTRFADAAADADRGRMASQLVESLRLVAFLTVPATVGLLVLGTPIIQLIYQHGRFTVADTHATAAALELYSVGLVAYAAVKVVAPAFYALDLARVPMLASMAAVAGNVTLNFILHPRHGYRILALGTAVAALLNFGILFVAFQRRIAAVDLRALASTLVRVGAASTVMGAAAWGAHHQLYAWLGADRLTDRLLGTLVPVALAVVVYALACRALRIAELDALLGRLRRRR